MAYIYNFCFYMSLRLGSIIIGIVSLIQGLIKIVLFSVAIANLKEVSNYLKNLNKIIDFAFVKPFVEDLIIDPKNILIISLIYSSFYTLCCILLIFGAYKFKTFMIYPYVCIEFFRLISLFAFHVISMMLIKENIINLGLLIGLTISGGFLLLGLFYTWFCTLNLALVISELMKEIEIMDITNFPPKPQLLPDVYTVRNNYMFNY